MSTVIPQVGHWYRTAGGDIIGPLQRGASRWQWQCPRDWVTTYTTDYLIGVLVKDLGNVEPSICQICDTYFDLEEGGMVDDHYSFCPDCWHEEQHPEEKEMEPQEGKALRFNKGKPEWSRLPLKEIEEVVRVLTDSAHNKYHDDPTEDGGRGCPNWTKGNSYSVFWESAMRHLVAWREGETLDKESGLPTLAHCIASVLFLMNWERRGVGVDDRMRSKGEG